MPELALRLGRLVPNPPASGVHMDAAAHDVLLVGGGAAGLRAAIAAAEINPKLSIAVVSKVYPMRSHTVSAEGGAAGVVKPDDSLDLPTLRHQINGIVDAYPAVSYTHLTLPTKRIV